MVNIHIGESLEGNSVQANCSALLLLMEEQITKELEGFIDP
jgi:hypothetical protein